MKSNFQQLTKREREILSELSRGQFYKEIAVSKNICIDTVKKHCKNIYRKLEVRKREEASRLFKKNI